MDEIERGREMNVSHATVHPVEEFPTTDAGVGVGGGGGGDGGNPPRLRMKDVQGMPGTLGGLALRACQFLFAVAAVCVMATTSDFPSVTAFRYNFIHFFFLYYCSYNFFLLQNSLWILDLESMFGWIILIILYTTCSPIWVFGDIWLQFCY